MVRKYEARGTELGGDAFYEDWVEVVRYEDYAKLEAELQKYKDQFPDYVECANCGSVTHVECEHVWNRYIVHPHRKICLVCGVKE